MACRYVFGEGAYGIWDRQTQKKHVHWCENVRQAGEIQKKKKANIFRLSRCWNGSQKMLKMCVKAVQSEPKQYSLSKYYSQNSKESQTESKKERKKELTQDQRPLSYHTLNKVTSCLLVRRVTDTTLFTTSRNTTPVTSPPSMSTYSISMLECPLLCDATVRSALFQELNLKLETFCWALPRLRYPFSITAPVYLQIVACLFVLAQTLLLEVWTGFRRQADWAE